MGGIRVTLPCQLATKLQRLLPTNTCFAEVSTYNALMHWDGASVSRLSEGSRRRRASSEHRQWPDTSDSAALRPG